MATIRFRGDAQPTAQVTWLTVTNVEAGDIFKLTINGKDISVTATNYATAVPGVPEPIRDPAHSVYQLLEAAIALTGIAEWYDIDTATAEVLDANSLPSTVLAGNYVALRMIGRSDGTPFTVSASSTDSTGITVSVQTTTDGSAGLNEKQRYSFQTTPTGGTYTLTFDGQTTGAIAYNASAATVQTALEALSNIAPGDVTVSGAYTSAFIVEFAGVYIGIPVARITGTGSSLTGACTVRGVTTTEGKPSTNLIQKLAGTRTGDEAWSGFVVFNKPSAPPVTFNISENLTADQFYTSYLQPIYGSPNAICTKAIDDSGVGYFLIEFTGIYAGASLAYLSAPEFTDGSVVISTYQASSATGADEVQVITLLGGPTGGTFTLTYDGQTTGALNYNDSAATVQAALIALSNIGAGDVSVAGSAGGPYTVTFATLLAATNVAQITGTGTSLTGGTVYVARIQSAAERKNETQLVTVEGVATGGTFTLTYAGQTTSALAYNIAATAVVTALEALSNIGVGDVAVEGAAGGPWSVTFQGALAYTNVASMTASGASLTGGGGTQGTSISTTVSPTSQWHADNAENYDGGALPTTGDTLIFENSEDELRYGLTGLSAVTLAVLRIKSTYTGKIGLPDVNQLGSGSYFEYREKYFCISATLCIIGEGDGNGAQMIRWNPGTVQTNCTVLKTGDSPNADPTLTLKGTHASNVLNINKGSAALAWYASETATYVTINCGYKDSVSDDVTLFIGSGCTHTTMNMSGGRVVAETGSAGAWTQTGGEATINGTNGMTGSIVLQKTAVMNLNNTGTIGGATVVAGEAVLNFNQDLRTKTITNPIEIQSEAAAVYDDFQVVTNLRLDHNYTNVNVNNSRLGTNVRITRGTPA